MLLALESETLATAAALGTLVRLAGLVQAHVKLEDERLYPELMKSHNPLIREKARHFQEEMGDLAQRFTTFAQTWILSGQVAKDVRGFKEAWAPVLAALSERMEREDNDLYVEYERITAA